MNFTSGDFLFAGVGALLVMVVWIVKHFANPPLALHRWAEEQGCAIVRAKYREFALGPFAGNGKRNHHDVYQVIIRTADGVKRAAWVRCNYAPGAERVEVVWGEVSSKSAAETRTRSPSDEATCFRSQRG